MSETWKVLEGFMDRLSAFYSTDDAHAWLCRPHPALGDQKPIDLIREGKADKVDAEIHMLETGSYS